MGQVQENLRFVGAIALAGVLVFGAFTPAQAATDLEPDFETSHTVQPQTEDLEGEIDIPVSDSDQFREEGEVTPDPEHGNSDHTEDPDEASELEAEYDAVPELLNLSPQRSRAMAQTTWGDVKNRRIGGANRYETATLVSRDSYPDASAVETVVIAAGTDFPDALSAAPLAAKLNAPLLMTQPTVLTPVTKTEIQRVKPKNIIVIGGTASVSSKVERDLRSLLPSKGVFTRIGGADRYETSVKVAQAGWPEGVVSEVFLAAGSDFPDALSAAAAAGSLSAPVILVSGKQGALGPQTRSFIHSKKTTTVHIVGGTGVMSTGIQKDAGSIKAVQSVKRYQGADRYATAVAVARQIFSSATVTYWASAADFPDALAGAAAAGAHNAPLIITRKDCVPSNVYDANDRLSPSDTVLIGGSASLSNAVLHGNECMSRPSKANNASFTGMQQLYAKINKARYEQGRAAFRLADSKIGTPAYSWAATKKFSRNSSLAKQQPWVTAEAVAKAPVSTSKQVDYVYSMFIKDSKNGTRTALLQTYGGARPYLSVGYVSGSTGYSTIYIGTTP